MTPRLGPGCSSCFRNGGSRSLWDVEAPLGPPGSQQHFCVQLWAERIRGAHFVSQVLVVVIVEGQITQKCSKNGRAFQESFQSNLLRKPFREREANISLHNHFQYFAVFATTKYLGFYPLNPWLLFIPHFPWAGTVSLQSVLPGFSQDTSRVFSFIQNTSCSRSNEAFFP